jgi:predicted ester cyclase
VVRGHGESTYAGGWHGIPPTGQRVTESCITIFQISGGKIRELFAGERPGSLAAPGTT